MNLNLINSINLEPSYDHDDIFISISNKSEELEIIHKSLLDVLITILNQYDKLENIIYLKFYSLKKDFNLYKNANILIKMENLEKKNYESIKIDISLLEFFYINKIYPVNSINVVGNNRKDFFNLTTQKQIFQLMTINVTNRCLFLVSTLIPHFKYMFSSLKYDELNNNYFYMIINQSVFVIYGTKVLKNKIWEMDGIQYVFIYKPLNRSFEIPNKETNIMNVSNKNLLKDWNLYKIPFHTTKIEHNAKIID